MEEFKIFNLDLNQNDQSYAYFSGYLLSKNSITKDQLNSIISFLSNENQSLGIKTFDGYGEGLEDYCSEFNFFNLEDLGDGCVVILDLNVIESGDMDTDLTEVFLCNDDDGLMIVFNPDGETSTRNI
jgi:hypothetical protein